MFVKREEVRHQEIDISNHRLGIYLSWAFNDPSKYPKKPMFSNIKEVEVEKVQSVESMKQVFKSIASRLGGK